MGEQIKNIGTNVTEWLKKLEKRQKIILAAVIVLVVLIGVIGAALLNHVTYTTLYAGMDSEQAGTVLDTLKEMGVPTKTQGEDTILVPEKQVDQVRMELAAKGIPDTGLKYDLFSNSSSFGSTDLERQTYLQYQLQENLRKTITRMDKVKDCVVLVNLPSNSSFVVSKETMPASAAVMLELEPNAKLSGDEARSIGELLTKSVPKLTLENVSITDSTMKSYSLTGEDTTTGAGSQEQQDMTEQMKNVLSEQVMRVLKPAIGDGNVAVSVNLNLDFDKNTVESVAFAPPIEGETDGMRRSSEKIYQAVRDGKATGGAAGTQSNGAGTTDYVYNGLAPDQYSEDYTEKYNYELNEVRTKIDKAQGAVKDLSVSVVVNSTVKGINGYQDAIKNLVANAIGVTPKYITVEIMPFVQTAAGGTFADLAAQNQENLKTLSRNSLIKTVCIVLALLLGLFMILNFFRKKREPEEADDMVEAGAETGGLLDLTAGDGIEGGLSQAEDGQLLEDMLSQPSGDSARVEELMESYPEVAVQIIRSWLTE